MQSDDVFCDMINSIQFLNMSKAGTDANMNYSDSGFNSATEMNADIFFYEDSCPPSSDCVDMKNNNDKDDCNRNLISSACDQNFESALASGESTSRQRRHDKKLTQIKVNVGIDEDLKMILEMDPSLMDGTEMEKAVEQSSHVVDCPKILGLPPKM